MAAVSVIRSIGKYHKALAPRVMLIRLSRFRVFQYHAGNCQKFSSFFSFFGTISLCTEVPPPPEKSSPDFFSEGGGRLYTG